MYYVLNVTHNNLNFWYMNIDNNNARVSLFLCEFCGLDPPHQFIVDLFWL